MSEQNKGYKVVYTGGIGEIVEKKSRFICTVKPVQSEEEATDFINEMKKKYWDTKHNCSAFVIGANSSLPDAQMMVSRHRLRADQCLMCFYEKVYVMLQ